MVMRVEPSVYVALMGLLSAPIAAYVGFRLNKKKTDTDISNSIASASGDAVGAIKEVMTALAVELKETKNELAEFKKQNRAMENALHELKEQNETLIEQNNKLSKEIDDLRTQIDRLQG